MDPLSSALAKVNIKLIMLYVFKIHMCACVCVRAHVCMRAHRFLIAHVKVRRQLSGVGSLLPSCQ